jgi:molybdopterin/thiamine biosynthesis adenylyltransferase
MREMEFTEERLERYSRHILLRDVGVEGQMKIFGAKVLIIGAGGLGSPAALYLAAAGVGTLGIADADRVELSNLQRQVIHHTPDIGKPKVDSAAEKIRAINPDVEVRTYYEWVRAANIRQMIRDYDFVIDGTDNFVAKFLINDACVLERKPFSHGGILQFNGQTMTVRPWESACYRCVFRGVPPKGVVPSCSEAGVLGVVAGMLGTIQAAEALKFITGVGELLTNSLLIFDAKDMSFDKVAMEPNPECAVCGEHPTIHELVDEEQPVCDLKTVRGKE